MYVLDSENKPMFFNDKDGTRKAMEYRYLEYNKDGYVLAIYNEIPTDIVSGNKIAIGDNRNFEVGYEFENLILIHSVDANNLIISCGMSKLPENIKYLRLERDNLRSAVIETQNAINMMLGV